MSNKSTKLLLIICFGFGLHILSYGCVKNSVIKPSQPPPLTSKVTSLPESPPSEENQNKIGTVISTEVVYKDPEKYIGWPTITKKRDGELLIVFSGDRDGHVCPWGKTLIIRSRDEGKTWTKPVVVNNTPLDDRDAGIIETAKGTLLVSWFTSLAFETPAYAPYFPKEVYRNYLRHAEKITPEIRNKWLGNWVRRSVDDGKTWQEPVRTICSSPHGPIQLKDGRLLYVGRGKYENKTVLAVEESKDDGCSWNLISTISVPPDESIEQHYHEPHVVELTNGKLIAMFRYQPPDGRWFMRQSESNDGGKTWTVAHKTPIWGFPPHLIQLKNGWLVVVYGRRKEPFGQRASISKDEGKTWDEIILNDLAPNGDLGYPASVQLDDGSIMTIYYQVDQKGERPCIIATRWRVE